jgi:hypothetical protein
VTTTITLQKGETWTSDEVSCVRLPKSYLFFDWFMVGVGQQITNDRDEELVIEMADD